MAVTPTNRSRINQPILFIIGSLILVGAILIYFFILRGIYGRFDSSSLIPDTNTFNNILFGEKPKVAILYSNYTRNMLPNKSNWLSENIKTWQKFLDDAGSSVAVINDNDIELGKAFDYSLIVLPGCKSLSDREIIQLKKFIDKGGSLFATGSVGTYSKDGKWRGWSFISEIFGASFSKEIYNDGTAKIHTLRGGSPITANIPTGYPLKVATWDRPMAIEVLDPRTTQISFWYNYRLEDGLVREEIKKSAGMVYGTYGKGRFIWMGFEINSVLGIQEDYILFERLFRNCINWLTYVPVAYVRDWPVGYDAAAVIAISVSNDAENTNNILPILKNENVPATFFVDPMLLKSNSELIKKLKDYGEIGALVDVGYLTSQSDTINKLNNLSLQTEKLLYAKSELESVVKKPVHGFLPYYGLYDLNTITAAINSKFKYMMSDSLTDRSVPKTIIRGQDRILSIVKTGRDDYAVIRDFGLTQPEFQFYTYQEDVDRVFFEGGLFTSKFHSEYQCKPENVNVISDLIEDLKKKNFWITTASEIQQWFQKKDYIEIRTERRSNSRVTLKVSNPGISSVSDLVVNIDLNEQVSNISLNSEIIGTKIPKFKYVKGSTILYLYINDLKPKESRTYYIDYEKIGV
ncbi:MAG TPA: polysaccharide deacetylase family protein [Ignavibacteriaceae bacterium]|nr:polysaccharide deacetylase family protein [Ignavibacteriaceae bacterium]